MSEFDSRARTWDENPVHRERSEAIAAKMEQMLPLDKQMNALEYGAGTGTLSLMLHTKLNTIVMMDSSAEMVKMMEEKMLQFNATNVFPVYFDLEHETSEKMFDLIFNQMVLHHIADVESLLRKFYRMILPGGFLAIADLYTEDGSFHGEGFNGHQGFDPENLRTQLLEVGFTTVVFEKCYTLNKVLADNTTKSFPIFLITASKN